MCVVCVFEMRERCACDARDMCDARDLYGCDVFVAGVCVGVCDVCDVSVASVCVCDVCVCDVCVCLCV